MTTLSDEALQTLQHEVQRLLGRCLLRLQQYERLIKAVVAHHELSGPVQSLEAVRDKRIADTSRKTLGTLVGDLLGSSIVTNESSKHDKETTDFLEDITSVGIWVNLVLPDADFDRMEKELKELVLLRNDMVHHFIDQHDLGSLDGCCDARDALVAASSRIDQNLEKLRELTVDMENTRRTLAEFIQSDAGREVMANGISPDRTVPWPAADVESALREAARELAVNGWAPVTEVGAWIAERHPEQVPVKYGCSSWRQVVHESRTFELRYREIDGKRAAWYREIEYSANSR